MSVRRCCEQSGLGEKVASPLSAEPLLLSWSSGKDSAMALHALRQDPAYRVEALLTTIVEDGERIGMHNVPLALLEQQAAATGLPLEIVRIPAQARNAVYEERMGDLLGRSKERGVRRVVFGDLFLNDIREYRDRNLARIGMSGLYPLWGQDTRRLAEEFIAQGFRAILTSVDPKQIASSFCGRLFDVTLLRDLPPKADPCGENGEFHTFVYDGPIFRNPISFVIEKATERNGFWHLDLRAADAPPT